MMKNTTLILALFLCSSDISAQSLKDLSFGEESTLEVITWNIERFPKAGQSNIDSVKEIILALDVDVLALQEIKTDTSFNQLLDSLPGYEGYHVLDSYPSLAYIYKTDAIALDSIYEIFTAESREFPRPPLVMQMRFRGETFIIINNHLKCCGDGIINHNDPYDEEKRRLDANILLDLFIKINFPNDRVILLGDLNDELTNSTDDNIFNLFIDEFTKYKFVDMAIAQGPSAEWSYPNWPSHLDHIMITDELFPEYLNDSSDIQVIKVDAYLAGGYSQYDNMITDHRPVALKIQITPNSVGVQELELKSGILSIYPNPSHGVTSFSIQHNKGNAAIEIYNMHGQVIKAINGLENRTRITWKHEGQPAGIYYVKLVVNDQVSSIQKLVLVK